MLVYKYNALGGIIVMNEMPGWCSGSSHPKYDVSSIQSNVSLINFYVSPRHAGSPNNNRHDTVEDLIIRSRGK